MCWRLQNQVTAALSEAGSALSLDEIAGKIDAMDKVENIYKIVRHLNANGRGVKIEGDVSVPGTLKVVGALIALYERAVSLYAFLVNINAYHQPGVEAGKQAAADVLELQNQVTAALSEAGSALSLAEIAGED